MDPKQQLSTLDPKLKEAYERVMGTSAKPTTQPQNPIATTAPSLSPSPTSVPMPNLNNSNSSGPFPTPSINTVNQSVPPASPQPMSPSLGPSGSIAQPPQMLQTPQPMSSPAPTIINPGSPAPQPTTGPVKVQFNTQIGQPAQAQSPKSGMGLQNQKKKGSVSPVLIVVAGIVFLIAYAIFWMKVFNIPIPFLG